MMLTVFITAANSGAVKYDGGNVDPGITAPSILSGGPDGYGYIYLSTQDGDPVTFNYIDISTTGTPTGAGDDWCSGSDASTLYYLGFSFPFYDQTIDSISICSNGTVVLERKSTYLGLGNTSLPSTSYGGYFGFIAVMWDDLNPAASSADDVYFQSFSSCPDGYAGACAVVQYHNVPRYGGSVYMDFEVILYDNGDIKFQYNSPMDYIDATVGMQDSTAADGTNPTWYLQYVYNGTPSTHVPDSGTAILFVYPTSTSVSEARNVVSDARVKVLGRTIEVNGKATLYDISGSRLATFKDRYNIERSGVYFVETGRRVFKVVVR